MLGIKIKKATLKSIISRALAVAVVLSMCEISLPVKAMGYEYHLNSDSDTPGDHITENTVFGISNASYPEGIEWNRSVNKLSFKGSVSINELAPLKDNAVLEVSGEGNICTMITLNSDFTNDNDRVLRIKMKPGAELQVGPKYGNPEGAVRFKGDGINPDWKALAEAKNQQLIIIENGKIVANGNSEKIIYDGPAEPDSEDGESNKKEDNKKEDNKKESNEDDNTEVQVGKEYGEKGKNTADSPIYLATSTDTNNLTVAYGHPEENVGEIVEIPDEVTLQDGQKYKVTEIKQGAFSGSGVKSTIREIHIGNNVEIIGDSACQDMPNLERVTFGKKVKKINRRAFFKCKKLKNTDLPESLEELGESAFEETAITSLTLKRNVKKLGKKACYKAKKLGKVIIKSSYLTKKNSIGNNAFGKTKKKLKVKIKLGKGKKAKKAKEKTIKNFKNKKVGYRSTWTIG